MNTPTLFEWFNRLFLPVGNRIMINICSEGSAIITFTEGKKLAPRRMIICVTAFAVLDRVSPPFMAAQRR